MLEALRAMFGLQPAPVVHGGPVEARLPNEREVELARQSGLDYGDPSAGFFQPGAQMRQTNTPAEAVNMLNSPKGLNETRGPGAEPVAPGRGEYKPKTGYTDSPTANSLFRAWLASKSSPLASLGFDPRHLVNHQTAPMPSQPQPDEAPMPPTRPVEFGPSGNPELAPMPQDAAGPDKFTVGGVYSPDADQMWTNTAQPSNVLHESTHRGIEMLRKAGRLPQGFVQQFYSPGISEEHHTRNLMRRHYGEDVERGRGEAGDKQIDAAKKTESPSILDQLQAAAAQMIAERNPRGPR